MTPEQASEDIDPFCTVDSGTNPAVEEAILLDRIDGPYYRAILDWFFAGLPGQASALLEVGCGTGQVLDLLVRRLGAGSVERAVGIDRSAFLAERAAKRFPGYEIFAADGRSIPLPDGQFDLTYTATVLVHAADPDGIVKEMYRLTRPGGTAAILDQDFGSAVIYPGDRDLSRRILDAATDFWQDGWIGRKLPALMRQAGFDATDVRSTVRVDRAFDKPFFGRIRDWVVEAGLPAAEADRWLAGLAEGAERGEFLFTRNFYSCTGIRG
jgi:ubiquinone/menaquinone biosynthesis C-methylase UbiE